MTLVRTRVSFALLLPMVVAPFAAAETQTPAQTVVIVHGAWGGGWDWKETAEVLESRGYEVYRPTLTGLGERRHLLSTDVDLTTHITDVVNVLRFEQLDDVILVGHSYGGMVITGVAEAVPERLSQLVYFDAFLPFDGECLVAVGRDEAPSELCNAATVERLLPKTTETGEIPPGWVESKRVRTGTIQEIFLPNYGNFSYFLRRKYPLRWSLFDHRSSACRNLENAWCPQRSRRSIMS